MGSTRTSVSGIDEPETVGRTELPDGRLLAWAAWGPVDGAPVLFFSGAAMGRGLAFGTHLLHDRGLRLITVDRPGLGASDPQPGRTLSDWPRDVAALAQDLRLDDLTVVGFSQGAPFALACAAQGLPRATVVVSGQDDLQHVRALLPDDVAALVDAAGRAPQDLERQFGSADAETILKIVDETSSDHDRDVYREPAFSAAYRRALRDGFAQGGGGYARDVTIAMGPWPFAVEEITVPVRLWYGARDTSPVHSPDHGETLTRRLPSARRQVVEDAGGSLLWTHADQILESL